MAVNLKVVDYIEPNGQRSKRGLPLDVPDSEAAKGIPLGINLTALYPEPLAGQLQAALWQAGIQYPDDLLVPGAATMVRQVIQSVLKIDANDIIDFVTQRKE